VAKSTKPSKAERLAAAKKDLQRTLDKTGVTALRKAGVRGSRPPIPAAFESDHRAKYPSADGFGKTPGKRELPADAIRFPVAHGHKQGYQPIFDSDWLKGLNKTSTLDDL
jgi:hypothetical protein